MLKNPFRQVQNDLASPQKAHCRPSILLIQHEKSLSYEPYLFSHELFPTYVYLTSLPMSTCFVAN